MLIKKLPLVLNKTGMNSKTHSSLRTSSTAKKTSLGFNPYKRAKDLREM
jgi:hypothetical protein